MIAQSLIQKQKFKRKNIINNFKDAECLLKNKKSLKHKLKKKIVGNELVENESEFCEKECNNDHKENDHLRLQEDLSEMSFGDLISLKNKLGTKVFNSTAFKTGHTSKKDDDDTDDENEEPPVVKKNKTMPLEVSSKLKGKRRKAAFSVKSHVARDPRFEEACGPLKKDLFHRSYSFIEDLRVNERKKLMKSLKVEKDPEVKEKIKKLLKQMKQREKNMTERKEAAEREKERVKEERRKVQQGKTPYFLKKSEKRRQRDEEVQERLSRTGGLQKYLKKKDQRQLQKDRKKMPFL